MSEEGLEVGRRGSQEAAQGSHPTCQGLVLGETSCPDCAVLAKGSWPFWLLSPDQGGVLPAQRVT